MRTFFTPLLALAALACAIVLPRPVSAASDLFGRVTEKEVFAQKLSGKLQKVKFVSSALGEERALFVYTPPGYPAAGKTYPVIVLLHGTPGGQLDWAGKGHATQTLDRAIVSGQFPAAILAFPDGHGPFWKGGSEWADDVNGRCRMETAITRDLPRFLRAHYAVSPDANQWTLGGLSEGAFGAANLTVRHPDVFRNALIFSGEFAVSDDWGDAKDVFGDSATVRAANSPADAIRRVAPDDRRRLRFYIAIGADDDQDLQTQGASFAATVRVRGGDSRFVLDRGRHDWNFWGSQFTASLSYLAHWLATGR